MTVKKATQEGSQLSRARPMIAPVTSRTTRPVFVVLVVSAAGLVFAAALW
jgi:hypothetical protein